ncbi:SAV_915 family protein [Kitasatospora sp. NPDC008050]|uniref:SAV_915 family protein n=1 Tax=Kitasatospora sp. NPDC008050 TaxID=3364021 RepID=UPI0036E38613
MTTAAHASQPAEAPEEPPDPAVRDSLVRDSATHGSPTCGSPIRYVPVREVPLGHVGATQVLRLFRQRDGSRCAVAFSSLQALHALLGAGQPAAELTESAVRELTEPLGVHRLVLDPKLVAPPSPARAPAPAPTAPLRTERCRAHGR